MIVFSDNFVKSEDETVKLVSNELDRADILVVVAVRKEGSVNWIQSNSQNVPNIICFDSSLALRNKAKGFYTLNCMVTKCGPQILNCLLNPNCRKALQCLNNCSPVDQSGVLFHYHGAARVAGQSYTGAVLVSPDGQYPAEKEKQRLISPLDRCGIKEWELFNVDNCSCENAPLGILDGSSLHSKIQVNEQTHSSV
uniref:Uncharacterized protein n=1 Tax=Solanum tuberosum TaxID=4113 RepID=M0ZZR3_SOLTU